MKKPKTRDIKLAKNQDERAVVFLKIEITDSEGNTIPKTFALTFEEAIIYLNLNL